MDGMAHIHHQESDMDRLWRQQTMFDPNNGFPQQMLNTLPHQQHLWHLQMMPQSASQSNQRLSRDQWRELEALYQAEKKPTTQFKRSVATSMGVPIEKINNWFQNRRAKEKQEAKKAEAAEATDGVSDSPSATSVTRPSSQPTDSPTPSASEQSSTAPANVVGSNLISPSPDVCPSVTESNSSSLPTESELSQAALMNLPSGPALPIHARDTFASSMYPSPDQTDMFSSPEQGFVVASQHLSSPDNYNLLASSFSETIPMQNFQPTDFASSHGNPFVSSEMPIPSLAFSDNITSSALTYEDMAPWSLLDPLASVPQTPIVPGSFEGIFSSQATPLGNVMVPTEMAAVPDYSFLMAPYSNDMVNSSSVSLPVLSDNSPAEITMPPPDAKLSMKPRQSSQPNLASRRRKAAPAAIGIGPIGAMSRAGSYTAGMPLSPRSPHLAAPDHALRRIKSSTNTAGRIQKPMTPIQKSPMALSFAQQQLLLNHQTPPPSACIDTPLRDVGYPNFQGFYPHQMSFREVPFSAPPTQQTFLLPSDGPFPETSILPSTPSPTTLPQQLQQPQPLS